MSGAAVPPALEQRWLALWERSAATGDGRAELAMIAERYGEPARRYHTIEHVADCLAELDRERRLAERPDEAELALWLHDLVYDSHADDNERRSAELAAAMLQRAGLPTTTGERISRTILATTHSEPPPPGDPALVCDADLAILGAEPARFAEYQRRIRDEYGWVPEPLYRRRRRAILERLLARPAIFATPAFRARLESRARANLTSAIARLG